MIGLQTFSSRSSSGIFKDPAPHKLSSKASHHDILLWDFRCGFVQILYFVQNLNEFRCRNCHYAMQIRTIPQNLLVAGWTLVSLHLIFIVFYVFLFHKLISHLYLIYTSLLHDVTRNSGKGWSTSPKAKFADSRLMPIWLKMTRFDWVWCHAGATSMALYTMLMSEA